MKILYRMRWFVLLGCLALICMACNKQQNSVLRTGGQGSPETPVRESFYQLNTSRYITMRDGIRIAVELYLPVAANRGRQVPAVVEFTRYWRSAETSSGFSDNSTIFTGHGYAHVKVDVRGTGASEGAWNLYSKAEQQDYYEVIDWIVHQPWSDGNVGVLGASYLGGAAVFAAAGGHPAVKAIAPLFFSYDLYTDIFFPGGLFNRIFTGLWNETCLLADRGDPLYGILADPDKEYLYRNMLKGIKPVDDDTDGTELGRILAARPGKNLDILAAFSAITFKDDPLITGEGKTTLAAVSPAAAINTINRLGIPVLTWEGWYDGCDAQAALLAYNRLTVHRELVIGPWGHGTRHHISPYLPPETASDTPFEEIYEDVVRFFNIFLMPGQEKQQHRDSIRYYTFGEEQWHTSETWPPPGMLYKNWYLAADQQLVPAVPAGAGGADSYQVDFRAGTGMYNRYMLRYTDIVYADRAGEDHKLLTYTSPVLKENLLLAGTPVVTLYLSSTHRDGALYVYLEDVAPEGDVLYLTEGVLRFIHRKIAAADPGADTGGGVYRSYASGVKAPLIPGQVTEITLPLNAVSVLFKKEHRIRIAIAGHDASVFDRVPDKGDPVLQVQRNRFYPSRIRLPVLP